jgi:hypothetical protein
MIGRRRVTGHAPAAPRDHSQRSERIPQGANSFPWRAGELVVGVGKPNLETDVMARCEAMYSRSPDDGETK